LKSAKVKREYPVLPAIIVNTCVTMLMRGAEGKLRKMAIKQEACEALTEEE
jgi:hypothetical protein